MNLALWITKEELIQDRIVYGISDNNLQKKLFEESDLTFKKESSKPQSLNTPMKVNQLMVNEIHHKMTWYQLFSCRMVNLWLMQAEPWLLLNVVTCIWKKYYLLRYLEWNPITSISIVAISICGLTTNHWFQYIKNHYPLFQNSCFCKFCSTTMKFITSAACLYFLESLLRRTHTNTHWSRVRSIFRLHSVYQSQTTN